jgi:hypothetical protein
MVDLRYDTYQAKGGCVSGADVASPKLDTMPGKRLNQARRAGINPAPNIADGNSPYPHPQVGREKAVVS